MATGKPIPDIVFSSFMSLPAIGIPKIKIGDKKLSGILINFCSADFIVRHKLIKCFCVTKAAKPRI